MLNFTNMHQFIVNATIQILPLAQDKHPYEWVDEAITIIQRADIKYEIRPFATELEGTYAQVMQVFNDVNEHLLQTNCYEWICNLQIQIRSEGDMTAEEKVAKFRS
jgi:uncharacterized protein YqgV (UPF0045/DUF77 family)